MSSSSKPEVNQNQNQNTADNSESQQSFQRFSHGDSRSAKFESDDTTTASETMNSNILQKKKSHAKKTPTKLPLNNNNIADNPVENIRKQLEKLEDLGDQLPTNENAYTLRYPFQDKGIVCVLISLQRAPAYRVYFGSSPGQRFVGARILQTPDPRREGLCKARQRNLESPEEHLPGSAEGLERAQCSSHFGAASSSMSSCFCLRFSAWLIQVLLGGTRAFGYGGQSSSHQEPSW